MQDKNWTAVVIAHLKVMRKLLKDGLRRRFCIRTVAEFSNLNHCCAKIESVNGQPDLVVITACADDVRIGPSIQKLQESWPDTQFIVIHCCGDAPKDAYALPNVHEPTVGDEELRQIIRNLGMDKTKKTTE